jgi:hypothetical protein
MQQFGVAATGDNLARAVDLLALPVTRDGLDSIVAYLGKEKQLAELQLIYVGKIHQRYPEPRNLVWSLVDRGGEGKAEPVKAALPRAAFQGGPLVYDVTMVPKSNALGALIVVSDGKSAPVTARLPKQPLHFAPVMLDRSFEVNRLALDRQKSLDPLRGLVIERTEVIQTVQQPVQDPLPAEIILEREKEHDICRAMHFRWKPRQNVNFDAAAKIVTPLCLAYGRPILEDLEVGNDQALIVRWEEGSVLYSLRLPYSDTETINLAVTEKDHSKEALVAREKTARANDEQDRQQRLAIRKPVQRLDRSHFLAGVKLGMSKEDVKKLLPQNPEWHRQDVENSVILSNLGQPNTNARPLPTSWLRRYVVRFDATDKVAEIRGFYTEGPGNPEPKNPALIDRLKLANGEPQMPVSPWAQVWADLPPVGVTAKCYRWQDDVTTLEAQWDPFGVQVTVRDNPKDPKASVSLPPLNFLGAGPEACRLGTTREELKKTWPDAPTTDDGGLVLVQPIESKFDALIVYLEKDRVQRVVGRIREKLIPGPGNVDAMIGRFYAEGPLLGLVRRRMPESNGQLLGGWGWHDDQVRVWAFAQETPEGPRLFVEWRYWPVAPTTTASR